MFSGREGRDRSTVGPAGQSPSFRDAVGRAGTATVMESVMAAVARAAGTDRNGLADEGNR